MFDLNENGKYFLINANEIDVILKKMNEIIENLKNLTDEDTHYLLAVRSCASEIDENSIYPLKSESGET